MDNVYESCSSTVQYVWNNEFFAIARKGVHFVRLSFVALSLSLSLLHSLPFLVYKNTSILISPLSSTPHTHS
jgi:hypothetical protein